MDLVDVQVPIFWDLVTPMKDGRKGDCCGIKFESISDGYYDVVCDFFFHKSCSNPPQHINHPSHKCDNNTLCFKFNDEICEKRCGLCRGKIMGYIGSYQCTSCDINIHLDCGKYPPPDVIDVPQHHDHKLMLEMVESCFTCAACREEGDGYSYKCHECNLTFHVNCGKYGAEVNHPSHFLHPLKLFKGEPPAYSDGTCRLCGSKIVEEMFYHCSICNFTLDLHCVFNPPPLYLHELNTHDHKLTLVPNLISFTCTTCGLNGDRSPYVCLQCNFFAHNDCSGYPWVININRHNHRVSRTSLIGVVNAVCGICHVKMDWSCGGYSCKRCPDAVFHTKCATRKDVWDNKEMKDESEEYEDTKAFKVIDENTIQHFLHEEHNLRLDKSGIFIEGRSCKACAYPIYHDSFYSCMSCGFILHESCAILPTQKRHLLSNVPYVLNQVNDLWRVCKACEVCYNGFTYNTYKGGIDARCASLTEPIIHQSHPHPLFFTSPRGVCNACNKKAPYVLRCVEDNCDYILDFKCALLPYKVKHRVDDHFLSLCYGEDASGKYWCDVCEKETDPRKWFYTCEDCGVTLHIGCVLGDFRALVPGKEKRLRVQLASGEHASILCGIIHNSSMSRPVCSQCKSRCIFPIILKFVEAGMLPKHCCSVSCSEIVIRNM